jgi:hypothetical protein
MDDKWELGLLVLIITFNHFLFSYIVSNGFISVCLKPEPVWTDHLKIHPGIVSGILNTWAKYQGV